MADRRNIIHVQPVASRGGIENNCRLFIASARDYDHRVVVLSSHGPMVEAWQSEGAVVDVLDIMKFGSFGFYRRLSHAARHWSAAYIICWSTNRLAWVLAAVNGRASHYRVHLGNPYNLGRISELKYVIAQWFLRFPADVKIKGVSNHVAQTYRGRVFYKRYPVETGYKPISVYTGTPADVRELDHQSTVNLGMIARLDPIKDHKTLISAFALVCGTYRQARLHIIGDGPLKGEIANLVEFAGLKEKVIMHGDVDKVYEYLAEMDLFVYATTYDEGLAGTIAEAMVAGVPVVSSDIPSLREYVDDESTVCWVKPFDAEALAHAVCTVLNDRARRQTMSRTARERITRHFSAQKFVERFLS